MRIETLRRHRLVVPVPENDVAGVPEGAQVDFAVPAFPGRLFHSPIARIAHEVDIKTRTMSVELAVASNLERTFITRIHNRRAEWVDVKTGVTAGNWIEAFGDLDEGDEVLTRGTEQLRPGTELSPQVISSK